MGIFYRTVGPPQYRVSPVLRCFYRSRTEDRGISRCLIIHPISANPNGPPSHSHWSPIPLVPQLAPTHRPFHWSPISLVPHRIGPFSPAGPPIHKSPPHCLNSLVPHLIGPPTLPFMPCSHWSPISLVPHYSPFYPVLIGPPSHWSPKLPFMPCSHWSPISLVRHCHPFYPVLIGPPSHWSPNVTLSTLFSLVPHLIGPPTSPFMPCSHWSPISLVPQSNPVYPVVLIGPPSHCPPPPPPPCNLSYPALIADIGKSPGPRSVTDKNSGGPVKPCIEAVRLSGKKFPYMEKESPSVGNLERSQGGLPPNAAL